MRGTRKPASVTGVDQRPETAVGGSGIRELAGEDFTLIQVDAGVPIGVIALRQTAIRPPEFVGAEARGERDAELGETVEGGLLHLSQ